MQYILQCERQNSQQHVAESFAVLYRGNVDVVANVKQQNESRPSITAEPMGF